MSADDPLLDAFEALRDAHDGTPVDPETRPRVMAVARRRARRTRGFFYVLVPAAATLFVTAAWADGTGRLGPWRAALRGVLTASPDVAVAIDEPAPEYPHPLPPLPRRAGEWEIADRSLPLARASRERGQGGEGFATPPPPTRAMSSPKTNTIAQPRAPHDAEGDLFATAQAAHFDARDPAHALHAWDAYLAAFPRGRFELEANYNRALTLLRLGRDDEARSALLPFAEGEYRRREARLLLRALDDAR